MTDQLSPCLCEAPGAMAWCGSACLMEIAFIWQLLGEYWTNLNFVQRTVLDKSRSLKSLKFLLEYLKQISQRSI